MKALNMKKIRMVLVFCICLFLLCLNIKTSYAAGLSVSANKSTVYVGETVTFTVSVSGAAGKINVSGAANDSIFLDNSSKSYSVTATAAGSLTVSASGTIADYDNPVDRSVSSSMTVTVKSKPTSSNSSSNSNTNSSNTQSTTNTAEEVKQEDTRSKENSLASLSVSEGTLSPSFKASTTSYTVNLPADKTKITISAKAKDSKASVSGTGEKKLDVGKNTFTVKCTAENGSVKSYKIVVNVDETPLVYTEYNGNKLGVVRNLDGIEGPNKSFKETQVSLDGKEIPAWTSEQMNKTIVYLVDENNEKSFYLFEDGKVTSKFEPISLNGINMFIVDIPEKNQNIDGLKFTTLKIEKLDIPGWIFEDKKFENYELIYIMLENGNMAYYLHEKTENTLMLYSDGFLQQFEEIGNLKEKNSSTELMRNIFIGTTGVFALSTAVVGYMYFNFKKKSISAIKDYYDKKNQG